MLDVGSSQRFEGSAALLVTSAFASVLQPLATRLEDSRKITRPRRQHAQTLRLVERRLAQRRDRDRAVRGPRPDTEEARRVLGLVQSASLLESHRRRAAWLEAHERVDEAEVVRGIVREIEVLFEDA